MNERVKLIEGEIFEDERGKIFSLNSFRFDEVRRSYFIIHPDKNVVRGWHGHKFEKKWFWCIKGEFVIGLVKIDNWENPDINLIPQIFSMKDSNSQVLYVPEGYANCIKATVNDSILMVYSGKVLDEALEDSWRYDKHLWVDWSKY